jgi:hypothetical protein
MLTTRSLSYFTVGCFATLLVAGILRAQQRGSAGIYGDSFLRFLIKTPFVRLRGEAAFNDSVCQGTIRLDDLRLSIEHPTSIQAASWKGNDPSHRTASIRVRAEARVTGRKANGPPSQESLGRVSQAHASRNGKPGAFSVEYWKFCICQRQLKKFPHFAS